MGLVGSSEKKAAKKKAKGKGTTDNAAIIDATQGGANSDSTGEEDELSLKESTNYSEKTLAPGSDKLTIAAKKLSLDDPAEAAFAGTSPFGTLVYDTQAVAVSDDSDETDPEANFTAVMSAPQEDWRTHMEKEPRLTSGFNSVQAGSQPSSPPSAPRQSGTPPKDSSPAKSTRTEEDDGSSVKDFVSDFGGTPRGGDDEDERGSVGGGGGYESGGGGQSRKTLCTVLDPDMQLELNTKMSVADFDLLKVLGKGSFGKVMLVKRKGKLFALKSLQKAKLVQRNQLHHTATERVVLQTLLNPFLVHLQYAFQTKDKLYMVLDYVGGGELFFWLKKEKRFSEERCALYCAEISTALACMHSADIVYRDLKPENILLDSQGHLKLTDFGLAKGGVCSMDGSRGTKTFCGTPEYLAPEILENRGHGKAVDWWALGTLLYEMLTGLPPFYDQNTQKMYRMILTDPLSFPKASNRQVSAAAKMILTNFLQRRIPARLGTDGISDFFREHDFFTINGIDFDMVFNKEIQPKFRPPVSSDESDVSNFDEEFTRETAQDSLVTHKMTSTMEEKSVFQNFTYKPEEAIRMGS